MSYTKGPWSYEERCSGIAIFRPSQGDEEEVITSMIIPKNDEDECTDEDEANARLISCAPEMLEMLKECQDALALGKVPKPSFFAKIQALITEAESK